MIISEFLIGVGVTLVAALIVWLANKFKHWVNDYLDGRKSPKPTPASEWKKLAEERRLQPDYKTDEEVLAEAIREYLETGKSTTIPTETLEALLLMTFPPPIVLPTKSKNIT